MINTQPVGDVTVVQLEHGKVNALDVELLDALTDTVHSLAGSNTSAIVLTGAGRAFSAGVDLFRVLEGGGAYTDKLIPALSRTFEAVFQFPRPVIAAINGPAIAGGCVLACACDWRLMADTGAPIGTSELAVGVPFPASALEIVRHACGDHTEGVILTAKLFIGPEAQAMGLVHEYVGAEALIDRAVAIAGELAGRPPDAYRLAKQLLRAPTMQRIAAAASNDGEVRRVWASPDAADAMRAQLDRTAAARRG
jgi:enoyl-CoA hydratase/carnithine racemase